MGQTPAPDSRWAAGMLRLFPPNVSLREHSIPPLINSPHGRPAFCRSSRAAAIATPGKQSLLSAPTAGSSHPEPDSRPACSSAKHLPSRAVSWITSYPSQRC